MIARLPAWRRLWPAVVAVALAAPSAARADEKQQCIAASDEGQQLRDDGKYRKAREAFERCSRDSCPGLVRRDCVQWLADLDQTSPSVVVSAKDDKGNDLVDVKVLVDGAPLVTKLDGKPTLVDPGPHLLRYEAAGYPAVEDRVVVHAGEKNRLLAVQFGGGAAPAAGSSSAEPPAATQAPPGGTPAAGWVLAGIAVVAFGSEAYFGLTGLSDRSDLRSRPCAQTATCSQSDVDAVKTKFLAADVSLGVGVVSAALAAYFFLSGHSASAPAAQGSRVDVAPLAGTAGALVRVGGSF
jgi:hypothetical protein